MKNLQTLIQEKLNTDSGIFLEKLNNNSYMLLEKLRLGKNTKIEIDDAIDISNLELSYKTSMLFNALNYKEKTSEMNKMQTYYRNHKKPKALYNKNTHKYTIANRWMCAILLEWDDAIKELQTTLYNTNFLPDNQQLQLYVYKFYTHENNIDDLLDYGLDEPSNVIYNHLYHYLELYNII